MSAGHWLLLVTTALSVFGAGQVWLVQLSSYPLWQHVGSREFAAYHLAWWHSIWGPVLAPAALVAVGAVLMLVWRAPELPAAALMTSVVLQAALIIGTAFWWGPLMARLEGPDRSLLQERYELLMVTHWGRVAIISAHALLMLWMLTLALEQKS